ncbi:MAG TPA: RNA-binding protein [Caulobacteraceae bacterium]
MPRTLAEAARERRDIVTGEVMDEARLIRFVIGPEGNAVPDLARKLPGRGVWVAADRASVETAARKGLFSRAAKAKVAVPADLADQVAELLRRRLLMGLGLARKSGELATGFEKVVGALKAGKAAVLIEALDGSADGRGKVLVAMRKSPSPPLLIGLYKSDELGLALGGENVVHSACLAGRTADRWTFDARRLSGFRPLFPESWREEP